jgi:hypothetical protein
VASVDRCGQVSQLSSQGLNSAKSNLLFPASKALWFMRKSDLEESSTFQRTFHLDRGRNILSPFPRTLVFASVHGDSVLSVVRSVLFVSDPYVERMLVGTLCNFALNFGFDISTVCVCMYA